MSKRLKKEGGIADFSIKVLLSTAIGMLLFGIYIGVLIYGENSLSVLNDLKAKKSTLEKEAKVLKNENQALQKLYFEFKQLTPDQEG